MAVAAGRRGDVGVSFADVDRTEVLAIDGWCVTFGWCVGPSYLPSTDGATEHAAGTEKLQEKTRDE